MHLMQLNHLLHCVATSTALDHTVHTSSFRDARQDNRRLGRYNAEPDFSSLGQRIEHHCSEIINESAGLSRRAHKATTKDVQKDFEGGALLAVIACRLNSLAAQR